MRKFLITIGRVRHAPRIKQEVYAENAQRAGEQADDLRESVDERVVVTPVLTEDDLLAADLERNTDKARKAFRREDACAMALQVQFMRESGCL